MDPLEQQLHDRIRQAGDTLTVPRVDPAADVRRGRVGLRRRRVAVAGGAVAGVATVVGGTALLAGGSDHGTRSPDPAGATSPSVTVETSPTVRTDIHRLSRGMEFRPVQVADAVAGYESVVLAGLDPEGRDGGPDLEALTRDHFLSNEATTDGDVATFTTDPTLLGADFFLRTPDGRSSISLTIQEGRSPEDCGVEGLVCHDFALDRDDVRARFLTREGALVGVVVDRPNGEWVSLSQVNDPTRTEPLLPWTPYELVQVALDPALVLPRIP